MPSSPDGEGLAAIQTKPDRKAVARWALAPSLIELLLLYLVLGMHIAMGTDAVVPFYWLLILWISVWIAGPWLGIRLLFFVLHLSIQGTRGVLVRVLR